MDSHAPPTGAALGHTPDERGAPMNISAVAAKTGVPPRTIRYYERIGLIPPAPRSSGGYRLYGATEVQILRFIKRARTLGFTIPEITSLLDLWRNGNRSNADVKALTCGHLRDVDDKIAEFVALRRSLAELVARCQGDGRPECPILDELATSPEDHAARPDRAVPALSTP